MSTRSFCYEYVSDTLLGILYTGIGWSSVYRDYTRKAIHYTVLQTESNFSKIICQALISCYLYIQTTTSTEDFKETLQCIPFFFFHLTLIFTLIKNEVFNFCKLNRSEQV